MNDKPMAQRLTGTLSTSFASEFASVCTCRRCARNDTSRMMVSREVKVTHGCTGEDVHHHRFIPFVAFGVESGR